MGRGFKSALVQSPAQRRVSYGVRLGCSGLYPVTSWKLSRLETTQPFWVTLLRCWAVLQGEEVSLIARLNLSCSNLCPLPLVLALLTAVKRFCALHNHLLGSTELLLGVSKAFSFSGRTSPIFLAFPYRSALAPTTLVALFWTCFSLSASCLFGGPKIAHCLLSNKRRALQAHAQLAATEPPRRLSAELLPCQAAPSSLEVLPSQLQDLHFSFFSCMPLCASVLGTSWACTPMPPPGHWQRSWNEQVQGQTPAIHLAQASE